MILSSPKDFVGAIMNWPRRKEAFIKIRNISNEDAGIVHYEIPMSTILTDFYDKIKSVSSGYASINYEYLGYREAKVVKMDILVAEEPVEALTTIVYEDEAFQRGKRL